MQKETDHQHWQGKQQQNLEFVTQYQTERSQLNNQTRQNLNSWEQVLLVLQSSMYNEYGFLRKILVNYLIQRAQEKPLQ